MTEERKRPHWPSIIALLIGLPVLYALSFWPAMCVMRLMLKAGWINEGGQVIFGLLYYPIMRLLGL